MVWREILKHILTKPDLYLSFSILLLANLNPVATALILFQAALLRIYRKRVPHLRLNNEERKELACLALCLPTAWLKHFVSEFSPDTIRSWYRKLVAKKYDFAHHRKPKSRGRPLLEENLEKFVLKFIRENPDAGDQTIADVVQRLFKTGSKSSIRRIRKRHDIPPANKRKSNWHCLKKSPKIWGMDFFTQEVLTDWGCKTIYVLFFCHWHTRKIVIGSATENPTSQWVCRVIRDLDFDDKFDMMDSDKIVYDNDKIFNAEVEQQFKKIGLRHIEMAIQSPKMNAHTERCVRTMREGTGNKSIWISQSAFMTTLRDFERHYNTERHHQGLKDHGIPFPCAEAHQETGRITKRSRCRGRKNFYYRKSA